MAAPPTRVHRTDRKWVGKSIRRVEDPKLLAGRGGSDSLGLANVDRRLRNVYGPWYGLVVETAVSAGTRVVVRIPRFQPGVMPG